MKTCALVFTYAGDYPKAVRLTKSLKDCVDTVYFCIESKDKDVPVPDWVTKLVIDFDRCKQLHGTQAIIGMKNVYTKLVEEMGYDLIFKVDSDTIVLQPEHFIKPIELGCDFAYIRRIMAKDKDGRYVRRCNGCSYSISAKAVREMNKIDPNIFDALMYSNDRHEDLVFSNILTENPNLNIHDVDKLKVWWSVKPYRKSDCIVCHFGYCDLNRIKEELEIIAPLKVEEVFSKENDEIVEKITKYCNEHNIPLKEYKNLYDKNGNQIEQQNEQKQSDSMMNSDLAKNKMQSNLQAKKSITQVDGIKLPEFGHKSKTISIS